MSVINTVSPGSVAPGRRRRRLVRWVAGILGGIALLVVIASVGMSLMMGSVPADLDLSTTRLSDGGLYRATIIPQTDPVPVNKLHSWTLHVETVDGQTVEHAQIRVDGDMPQHKHGLPTQPQVTKYLGNGDYLVEGLKFQMGGWWVVEFVIAVDGQDDHVLFNLMLR